MFEKEKEVGSMGLLLSRSWRLLVAERGEKARQVFFCVLVEG